MEVDCSDNAEERKKEGAAGISSHQRDCASQIRRGVHSWWKRSPDEVGIGAQ